MEPLCVRGEKPLCVRGVKPQRTSQVPSIGLFHVDGDGGIQKKKKNKTDVDSEGSKHTVGSYSRKFQKRLGLDKPLVSR